MRLEREIAKKFRAIKKYYAYLRVCAFNDAFGNADYFYETEVLGCLESVLENEYQYLKIAFRKRAPKINFFDETTISQINELFRLIFKIENKICSYCNELGLLVNESPYFSFAT